ncbi:MAG: serine hydrolase [Flavobacteriaceae bacterium]|nr:MAG: serine hydrolase [Flavobacteriaceae bacterium]
MNKKISSLIVILTTLIISSCINSCCLISDLPCETPQHEYAIDKLPGCEDCTSVLDQEMLTDMVNMIETGEYGNIHSLIIIHNDSLALEEYFMGWTRDMRHYLASAAKSITSSVIGIAIDQGKIGGVDETLLSFFPEYSNIANLDERKESITLKHVLTMSSGFTWEQHPDEDLADMKESKDWIKFMLDFPMSDEPGTKFWYNNGTSHLLSGIITKGTGQSAEEFAEEYLFDPLGITNWEWESDPQGNNAGGWGLYLHPANMAIFGYLFLKNGLLNGMQIISDNWVKESTAKQIEVIDPVTGQHTMDYGYQWWRTFPMPTFNMFYAAGFGGQFIFVIPNLNMVVVMTAENSFEEFGTLGLNILLGHIVPAVYEK